MCSSGFMYLYCTFQLGNQVFCSNWNVAGSQALCLLPNDNLHSDVMKARQVTNCGSLTACLYKVPAIMQHAQDVFVCTRVALYPGHPR